LLSDRFFLLGCGRVNRKLLPSLLQIQQRGLLSDRFFLLGCGRTEYSDEQFRQTARAALGEHARDVAAEAVTAFVAKLHYLSGDYADPKTYEKIGARLTELRGTYRVDGCNLLTRRRTRKSAPG